VLPLEHGKVRVGIVAYLGVCPNPYDRPAANLPTLAEERINVFLRIESLEQRPGLATVHVQAGAGDKVGFLRGQKCYRVANGFRPAELSGW